MLVIPAIDLSEGKVVRLTRGDFAAKQTYSDAPDEVAARFEQMGAKWLHVVDLDGAKAGAPQNVEALHRILGAVRIPVQFGGGIRLMHTAELVLGLGVSRVVIGSALAKSDRIAEFFFRKLGERCAAGIDSRRGRVAVSAWQQTTRLPAYEFAKRMQDLGCRRIIHTAIERDGMLEGPDFAGLKQMAESVSIPVIASGGVGGDEHLRNLSSLGAVGLEGVIVGKALYENRLDLRLWTQK